VGIVLVQNPVVELEGIKLAQSPEALVAHPGVKHGDGKAREPLGPLSAGGGGRDVGQPGLALGGNGLLAVAEQYRNGKGLAGAKRDGFAQDERVDACAARPGWIGHEVNISENGTRLSKTGKTRAAVGFLALEPIVIRETGMEGDTAGLTGTGKYVTQQMKCAGDRRDAGVAKSKPPVEGTILVGRGVELLRDGES